MSRPAPPATVATSADPKGEVASAAGEGHTSPSERMAAAESLRHTRRDATHLIRHPPHVRRGRRLP